MNSDAMAREIELEIHEYFDTNWHVEDFLQGYMTANDIDDEDRMTQKDWEDFYNRITEPGVLRNFKQVIIQEINERIPYLF